jgi:GTPase SAR1 family protein
MGCGASKADLVVVPIEEKKANQVIGDAMAVAHAQDKKVKKLLLLGAGASGKSTLYRQLSNIYGEKFDEQTLGSFVSTIHSNVLNSYMKLAEMSTKLDGCEVLEDNRTFRDQCLKFDEIKEFNPEILKVVKALWNDPGIQKTFERRNEFQFFDSFEYFNKRLEDLARPDYLPTLDDALHSRAATTGIVETKFQVEDTPFLLVDVGGQRNERKKWINCFDGVTSVIYVASLSAYNEKLFEDETVNTMMESLKLFEDTFKMDWCKNINVILFLNKSDLFRKKIEQFPITCLWPEYTGPGDFESTTKFIELEYRNRLDDSKDLYCHVTCATDTSSVQFTFNAVKSIIIRQGLSEAGVFA